MVRKVSSARPQPGGPDRPGQGVGDGVEVGRNVQAVEDVVVAGVADDHDVLGRHGPHQPPEEAGRPDTPGKGSNRPHRLTD